MTRLVHVALIASLATSSGCFLGIAAANRQYEEAEATKKPLPETIEPLMPLSSLRWYTHPEDPTPQKVAWVREAEWEPVRGDTGLIVGRRSTNFPVIYVSHEGLMTRKSEEPKAVCYWAKANIEQKAMDNLGMTFEEGASVYPVQMANSTYIDCGEYEALPSR